MRKNIYNNLILQNPHYGVLLFILITFSLLNFYTPYINDDFIQMYFCKDSTLRPVLTFKELLFNQIDIYNLRNGRIIPNFLSQLFLIYIPKGIFNVINSLFVCLFFILILKYLKLKVNFTRLLVAFALGWFLLPSLGETMLWLVGSVNYLWSTIIILMFLQLFDKLSTIHINKFQTVLLFFLGIATGLTHEAITLPLSGAFVILFTIERKKFNSYSIILILGLFIGTAFSVLAPGNFVRLADRSSSVEATTLFSSIYYLARKMLHVFDNIYRVKALFLLVIVWSILFVDNRSKAIAFIKENGLLIITTIFSLLFLTYIAGAFYYGREYFCISFFSFLLLLRLLFSLQFSIGNKLKLFVYLLVMLALTFSSAYSISKVYRNYLFYTNIHNAINESTNGIVNFDSERAIKSRFIVFSDIPNYPFSVFSLNHNFEVNLVLAYVGKKDKLTFVPSFIYNNLKREDNICTATNLLKGYKNVFVIHEQLNYLCIKMESGLQTFNQCKLQCSQQEYTINDCARLQFGDRSYVVLQLPTDCDIATIESIQLSDALCLKKEIKL